MPIPEQHEILSRGVPYVGLMLLAITLTVIYWGKKARGDQRLLAVYVGGLVSAFVGAKLVFLLAEGWLYLGSEHTLILLASGKTIIGALLGGYLGVEITKRFVGYDSHTGDLFATVVPFGIILGRFGCLASGCCLGNRCATPTWYTINDAQGIPRWPAAPAEIAFNLIALAILFQLRRHRVLPGQHFHLYLIGYGLFRFAHEFARSTPKIAGAFSGYHFAALALILLGAIRFAQRAQPSHARGA